MGVGSWLPQALEPPFLSPFFLLHTILPILFLTVPPDFFSSCPSIFSFFPLISVSGSVQAGK